MNERDLPRRESFYSGVLWKAIDLGLPWCKVEDWVSRPGKAPHGGLDITAKLLIDGEMHLVDGRTIAQAFKVIRETTGLGGWVEKGWLPGPTWRDRMLRRREAHDVQGVGDADAAALLQLGVLGAIAH